MALIKCSICSGTVSTKAPACPHCGSVTFNETSEAKSVEELADQLGSMSAAISAEDGKESSKATVEKAQTNSQGRSIDAHEAVAGIVGLIVMAYLWNNFGMNLAGTFALTYSTVFKIWSEHSKRQVSDASSKVANEKDASLTPPP